MTRREWVLALTVSGVMAVGCADEGATKPSANADGESADGADLSASPVTQVASQSFELAAGHTVTIHRFSDDSFVFAEVGTIGEHDSSLENEPGIVPLAKLVKKLAPDGKINKGLTKALDKKPASNARATQSAPPPLEVSTGNTELERGHKDAPKSTDTPATGAFNNGTDLYTLLRCDDLSATFCNSAATTSANTPWDFGGYYRSRAFNAAYSGSATFTISRWDGNVYGPVISIPLAPHQWGQMHYLPSGKAYAYASISGPSGAAVGISALVGSVAPRAQEQDQWCWLASSAMVISSLGVDPPSQCAMANNHWQRNDCCTNPAACNGSGEVMQILKEYKYSFNGIPNAATNSEIFIQALQGGPVVLHDNNGPHYRVASDYAEKLEAGSWVPYAMVLDPWNAQDYSQEHHVSWQRVSDIVSGTNDWALADVRNANRSQLSTAITRVSWDATTSQATVWFDAPGADGFAYNVYDGGGSSDPGALWNSGWVDYADAWNTTSASASFHMGGWTWFYLEAVGANRNLQNGPTVSGRWVSRKPIPHIDSLSWSNNTITANLRADPAPVSTAFRYRVINANNSQLRRAGRVVGSAQRFSATATISAFAEQWKTWKLQVQACNDNGCSEWVESSIYAN